MSNPTRLIIVDDHPLFREGVLQALVEAQNIEVIGQAGTGEEALQLIQDHMPDMVLLDITLPNENGLVVAQEISVAFPVVQIVMLTASEDEDDLVTALKAGAQGYIVKGVPSRELINAIRIVADGGTYVSPALAGPLLLEWSRPSEVDPLDDLTERERQILELVGGGLTNREIGQRLSLAEKTVKHYMTNILQKLHVRSRVEAALLAQKKQLS